MIEVIILITLAAIILSAIFVSKKRNKLVKANSNLYKMILAVNAKYKFDNSLSEIKRFNIVCKSKRQLENFDFTNYITAEMRSQRSYYESLFNRLEENDKIFSQYTEEYRKIEKYSTIESLKNVKMKVKTFVSCEKRLYINLKKRMPITEMSAICIGTYTSPAGRNSYQRDFMFTYDELRRCFAFAKNPVAPRAAIQTKEQIKSQQLIEIEKKLTQKKVEYREIEKAAKGIERDKEKIKQKEYELKQKEKKLESFDKREEYVVKKEEEFLSATNGHIYSATDDQAEEIINTIKIEDTDSEWVKLKKLKQLFDSGEITYEEYSLKRGEML